MPVFPVDQIIIQLGSSDRDYRFMALNDLVRETEKSKQIQLRDREKEVVKGVLNNLQYSFGDVSSLAVKCIGMLMSSLSQEQVKEVFNNLSNKLVEQKSTSSENQIKELGPLALKSCIQGIEQNSPYQQQNQAKLVAEFLMPKLLKSLQLNQQNATLSHDILEVQIACIQKFGDMEAMQKQFNEILKLVWALQESRQGTRRKAIQCLGTLSTYLSKEQLDNIVNLYISKLQTKDIHFEQSRTYVQALGQLSNNLKEKFQRYAKHLAPLLIDLINHSDEDLDLKESILSTLESFISGASYHKITIIDEVLKCAQKWISHDPNYEYDEDTYMDEQEEQNGYEDEDDEYQEEYSDDDDQSWKVRRSSIKILQTIIHITNDPSTLQSLQATLQKRFTEREVDVRYEIFTAYLDYLKKIVVLKDLNNSRHKIEVGDQQNVVKAMVKQLQDKKLKKKSAIYSILIEITQMQPSAFEKEKIFQGLMSSIQAVLKNSLEDMRVKVEALSYLEVALQLHPFSVIQDFVRELIDPVITCVKDKYFKLRAQALLVCNQIIQNATSGGQQVNDKAFLQQILLPIYNVNTQILQAGDQDQEVKEATILTMTSLLSCAPQVLDSKIQESIEILLDKMKHDNTRLPAVKSLVVLFKSSNFEQTQSQGHDLSKWSIEVLQLLITFLRKADRPLRVNSLEAIDVLLRKQIEAENGHVTKKRSARKNQSIAQSVPTEIYQQLLEEIDRLLVDEDLFLAAQTINVTSTILETNKEVPKVMIDSILSRALYMIAHSAQQTPTLKPTQKLILAYLHNGQATMSDMASKIIDQHRLMDLENIFSVMSLAQTYALVCVDNGQDIQAGINYLMGIIQNRIVLKKTIEGVALALYSLGELGLRKDLTQQDIAGSILNLMSNNREEIRVACSHALGGYSRGNLDQNLTNILNVINDQRKQVKLKGLYIRAANVIARSFVENQQNLNEQKFIQQPLQSFQKYEQDVLNTMLSFQELDDDNQSLKAECLSNLAILNPDLVLPALQQQIKKVEALQDTERTNYMKVLSLLTLKNIIPEQVSQYVYQQLQESLQKLLELLQDPQLPVRKISIAVLSMAARNKASLIQPFLPQILPLLYKNSYVDPSLIREVYFGPIKEIIDDGIELRKSVYDSLILLIDTCKEQMNLEVLIESVIRGIDDKAYNVKITCLLLVDKLSDIYPQLILDNFDQLSEPLSSSLITKNVKNQRDYDKQMANRQDDVVHSSLLAIMAIQKIPESKHNQKVQQFLFQKVFTRQDLASKFHEIKQERPGIQPVIQAMEM